MLRHLSDWLLRRNIPDDDRAVKDVVVNDLTTQSDRTLRRVDRLVRLARTDAEIDVRTVRKAPR